MKKVLIITYYWPPFAGSGVQRWLKFSKYLPDFGFKPYIYTPENPHFNISDKKLIKDVRPEVEVIKRPIWEPYSIADLITGKKPGNQGLVSTKGTGFKPTILHKIRANFFIPDPRKFWVRPSIKFLKGYIKKEGIEYIISTGPPHSMHLIAKGLKLHDPGLKWIVDIRDPWSRFDFLKSFGSSEKSLEKQAELESSVLDLCDRIIATSEQMKDLLVDFEHSKFQCITNGYDKDDFKEFNDLSSDNEMRIYHAGLLNQVRNPSVLWKALDSLCRQNKTIASKLKLHLAGVLDDNVVEEIRSYGELMDRLTVESYKSHEDVILDYSKSDVLLLLVNNTDNAKANIPGKLFEYLATGKKILIISDEDTDAARLLEKRKFSFRMDYSDEEIQDMSAFESFLLSDYTAGSDADDFKSSFERKNLTSKLVNLLLEL